MKMFKAVERAEEGQHDCFWHDHSEDLRYLLVLPGATPKLESEELSLVYAQSAGRVTTMSPRFRQLSLDNPDLFPGATGPLTVMLIL